MTPHGRCSTKQPTRSDAMSSLGSRDEDALATTEFVQPAILACDVAAFRVLEALGVGFVGAAGHSLGEFAALVAAGVLELVGRAADRGGAWPGDAGGGRGPARNDDRAPRRRGRGRGGAVRRRSRRRRAPRRERELAAAGGDQRQRRRDRTRGGPRRRAQDPGGAPERRGRVPLPADGTRGRTAVGRDRGGGVLAPAVPDRLERHGHPRHRPRRAPSPRRTPRGLPGPLGGERRRPSRSWAPTRSSRRGRGTCSPSSRNGPCPGPGPSRWARPRPRPRSPRKGPDHAHDTTEAASPCGAASSTTRWRYPRPSTRAATVAPRGDS